jgi:hypothetical protein
MARPHQHKDSLVLCGRPSTTSLLHGNPTSHSFALTPSLSLLPPHSFALTPSLSFLPSHSFALIPSLSLLRSHSFSHSFSHSTFFKLLSYFIFRYHNRQRSVLIECPHCLRLHSYDPFIFDLNNAEKAAAEGSQYLYCRGIRPVRIDQVRKEFNEFYFILFIFVDCRGCDVVTSELHDSALRGPTDEGADRARVLCYCL